MRYSNEFYFVTPAGLLETTEVPADSGLVEVGTAATIDKTARIAADLRKGFMVNSSFQ